MAEQRSRGDLQEWITRPERTREQRLIFGARITARAIPALAASIRYSADNGGYRAAIILPTLRAMVSPWIAASHLPIKENFYVAAGSSVDDARAIASKTKRSESFGGVATADEHITSIARLATTKVAYSASDVAYLAGDISNAIPIVQSIEACANAAYATATYKGQQGKLSNTYADADIASSEAEEDATRAARGDIEALDSIVDASKIATIALWHSSPPAWISELWQALREYLLAVNEGWEVWVNWYEHRLAGASLGLPLERAWLELADQDWNQEPFFANGKLKKSIDSVQSYAPPPTGLDLTQRPSAFTFNLIDGQILARATTGHATSHTIANQILGEVRAKAHDVLERAKRSNASNRIISTLERLSSVLNADAEKLELGILLMRIRTLEADVVAYNSAEGRKEISEDFFSMLKDLVTSLYDLKASYPEIIQLESARVAQQIAASSTSELLAQMTRIADAAKKSESVHQSAIAAFEIAQTEIETVGLLVQTAPDEAVRAEAIQKQSELAAQHALDQRNFVSAVLKPFVKDAGSAIREAAISGLEDSVHAGVKVALASLVAYLADPIMGIGVLILSWKPLGERAKQIEQDMKAEKDVSDI